MPLSLFAAAPLLPASPRQDLDVSWQVSTLVVIVVLAAAVLGWDRLDRAQKSRDIKATERQARAGLVFVPGSLTVATDTVSVEPEPVEPVEPAAAVVPPAPYRAKHRGQGEPGDVTSVIPKVHLHTNAGRVVGRARKPLNTPGVQTRADGSVRA